MVSPVATVIIPNFNGMAYLPRLMESLHSQTEPRLSILVVDDCSKDGSPGYLEEQWRTVRVIRNAKNRGFAGTCNAGLREAATEFVVLLNNDTHVDGHWLEEGLKGFDAAGVAGVASLVLLADSPGLVDTAGDVYSVAGGAVKRCHLHTREEAERLPREVFAASGVSAFYRRAALEEVGYLDETLESYYEDADLGFRLAWAGYRCVFAPRSVCYHHLSASYDPRGWRYHFNSARNNEIVWRTHVPEAARRKYAWARWMYLTLQGAHKLRIGCYGAWRAGRNEAAQLGLRTATKREKMRRMAKASWEQIEGRLEHDWWTAHVSSRRRRGAEAPA